MPSVSQHRNAPGAVRDLTDGISPEPKHDSEHLSARGHPLGVNTTPIISWYCTIPNEKVKLVKVHDSVAYRGSSLSDWYYFYLIKILETFTSNTFK